MIPFGTLFNISTILIGSLIGLFLNKKISADLNQKVFFVIGLFTVVLGLSMAVVSSDFLLILISLILGTIFGEYYRIDVLLNHTTKKLKKNSIINYDQFSNGLITSFLLFCVGSMTIVGAIEEGMINSRNILYTKYGFIIFWK